MRGSVDDSEAIVGKRQKKKEKGVIWRVHIEASEGEKRKEECVTSSH